MLTCTCNAYRRADKGLRNVGIKASGAFTGTIKVVLHGIIGASDAIVSTEERRCRRQEFVSRWRKSADVVIKEKPVNGSTSKEVLLAI